MCLLTLAAGHVSWADDDEATEEVIDVPTDHGIALKTRVLRPAGDGPFPLAIVSHGSPASAKGRPSMVVPRFRPVSGWLIEQGYMVALPLRRGYGETGGRWAESYGSCSDPDYYKAGMASAEDIENVLSALQERDDVRSDRVLLVGWSAGGWGSIAAASNNPDGVFAVLNFAGGRGGVGNCTPERLVEAARKFGKTSRVPSLWLYSSNDQYFSPRLSRQMFGAFTKAGGVGQYVELPAFGSDGHRIFGSAQAIGLWRPPVEKFLSKLRPRR